MHITQPGGACKRVNAGRCQPLNTKISNHLWSRPAPLMYTCVSPTCVRVRTCACTFQVNYSIIAVDILLFVAVVDRRPAAESGSLSTLFAPRILAISCALFLAGSIPVETIAVATVISAARIRVSSSVSIGSSSNLQLRNYLIYLSKYLKSKH